MYVGHLYKWKGVDTMIEAAKRLKGSNDLLFMFVGGTDQDISQYENIVKEKGITNIVFTGHKSHQAIPQYLKAADFLPLPNAPVSEESEKYTSPIKMFEYMASRRLILGL